MLEPREIALWSQPPPLPRSRDANIPTILFSWWCTIFAAVIIITRLCGRMSRSNKLFREDWIMMLALVPLFVRMGFIHVILLYGTNNVQTAGANLTAKEIYHREVGARLVLAARIFYALFIWTSKFTVSEFLKRITHRIWRRSYEWTLRGIRIFLVLTFFLVVIVTLTDCQPFSHYWQVIPDPGSHCRQGYGNLLAMGICDMITDILLIAFPIPIILQAGATWKRKVQLVSLFGLSIVLIAITATRIPRVIQHRGSQQYRSVWASVEILASTAVSNAVILGAFLRDKGSKKTKFKSNSVVDSIDRASVRRPTVVGVGMGSDEDLFRAMGMKVPEHLQDEKSKPRPAPVAMPAKAEPSPPSSSPSASGDAKANANTHSSGDSDDSLRRERPVSSMEPLSKQDSSPFDVGGLLENGVVAPAPRSRVGSPVKSDHNGTIAHDFAPHTPSESRRPSHAALQDVSFSTANNARPSQRHPSPDNQSTLRTANRRSPAASEDSNRDHHHHPRNSNSSTLLAFLQESRSSPTLTARQPSASSPSSPPATEQHELKDLGGLLSGSHHRDASSTAVSSRTTRRSQEPQEPQPRPSDKGEGWQEMEMEIGDAGGLLGK